MPFCSTCLLELPESERLCPVDRTLLLERNCPKCLHSLGRLDRYCGLCAESVDNAATPHPVKLKSANKLRIFASLAADLHIFCIAYAVCMPAFIDIKSLASAIGFGLLGPAYWVSLTCQGRQTIGQYLSKCIAVSSRAQFAGKVHPSAQQIMGGVANRLTLKKLGLLRKYDWNFEVLND
jgi:hypothetical protein